ncbi:MAG TPA: SMC-Scp complex subunit ScpB, partial [Novosphingobium sp.]|nr:SMC-Scp complex subunit ScpB [Novosphingobium sp.]
TSRRDPPGIDELRAAGLLDPVEDALAEAMETAGEAESAEAPEQEESAD